MSKGIREVLFSLIVGVEEIFGLVDEEMLIQRYGSISCIQDRMIVFPNVYQHQVQPFELSDPSKHGHRKILAFFVVDPEKPVLSTKSVPFQRSDWATEAFMDATSNRLPKEIAQMIVSYNGTMSLAEAKLYRKELMDARAAHNDSINDSDAYMFSLCEY